VATTHPDLAAEQAYLARAYERLEAMRQAASSRLGEALGRPGKGTPQSLTERDIVVRTSLQRLEQLDIGDEALCFGRIDSAPSEDPAVPGGESFHIGRLAISGEDQEPLVVDWRAPVAEPFYRATGRHPMGLRLRRHFATHGPHLLGIEDELFGAGRLMVDGDPDKASGDGTGVLELSGPEALLTALERGRSGRMRDIVATVQREQDEIIRAPLPGVLVVQGGPGTGKTAVALHRAAYLLYTYRFPLERQGVLVVGPNPLFLRYIEFVLPSLGETGVTLTSIDGLFGGARATGDDGAVAGRVKGDVRMVKVLARAVRDRQRPLTRQAEIPFGPLVLRVSVEASASLVAAVRRRGGTHNARRRQLENLLYRHLHERYTESIERARRVELRGGTGLGESADRSVDDLADALRGQPAVVEVLDRMWPILTPLELLHDLYGAKPLLRSAGRNILSEEEALSLFRARSRSFDDIAWTSADMALLDEARVLLGARRQPAREKDEIRGFGHIVVDEAQDLSPMQLRMLTRRSLGGSMTVVGDVAQATGRWAPKQWDEVLAHLPSKRDAEVVELTVNYRTPAEIMELATRVLAVAAPHVRAPESVRSGGDEPMFCPVSAGELAAEVARVAGAESEAMARGTVAVIATRSMIAPLREALAAAGVDFGEPAANGLDAPVTLVPVDVVKGLEFDSVVVVEPARITAEAAQGLRALFVVLTRATRRLTVVHAEPLPEVLGITDGR
jgi:DNA helicase IV